MILSCVKRSCGPRWTEDLDLLKKIISLTSPQRQPGQVKLLASILTCRCKNHVARRDIRTDQPGAWAGVMLTVLKQTMKFPTVLAATAMVAGFVPFGQAVCYNGNIALARSQSSRNPTRGSGALLRVVQIRALLITRTCDGRPKRRRMGEDRGK